MIGSQVSQPFSIETSGIHIETSRRGKDLCIAGPSQTLITLGTIGRDIQEVTPEAPLYVFLQTVNQRIGTFKITCRNQVRMNYTGFYIIGRYVPFEFNDFNIPETVKGKGRFMRFNSFTLEDIAVFGPCHAQVFGIEVTFPVKYLSMLKADSRTSCSFKPEPHPADDILSQVEYLFALRGDNHFNGPDSAGNPHRHTLRGYNIGVAVVPFQD